SSRYDFNEREEDDPKLTRFKSKEYMDDYINPREALKAEEEEQRRSREQAAKNFPERPDKDVLLFLIEQAPLKGRQGDVFSIVGEEAYFFAQKAKKKIMTEGWASYWPSTMRPQRALSPSGVVDSAAPPPGTMATSGARLNPYKLGIELFRDIEHR